MEITKKVITIKSTRCLDKKKLLEAKFSDPLLKSLPGSPRSKSEKVIPTAVVDHVAAAALSIDDVNHLQPRRMYRRFLSKFNLIWLDSKMNDDDDDLEIKQELEELRKMTGTIHTFYDTDQCVSHVHTVQDKKIFVIVSDNLASQAIPQMHDLNQLESIYIHTSTTVQDDPWTHQWIKVKGSFDKIQRLHDVIRHDLRQFDRDSLSISVTNTNVNYLNPSFMYTQILKEILIEQPSYEGEKIEFVNFCRDLFNDNPDALCIIDEFEQDYHKYSPIWWYTRESFMYRLINEALRAEDFEIIIKMGFFLRDVHQQIQELHAAYIDRNTFSVYRGQGISMKEFENIQNSQGGLLAFNSFLSTTSSKNVSLSYAREALRTPNSIGIIFEMSIDPCILSTSFANVKDTGYFRDLEKEILFSMHSVFRIDEMKEIEHCLWWIKLRSANVNDDRNSKRLMERVREDTKGKSALHRLSKLLTKAAKFAKAEEVTHILLRETSADNLQELGQLYQQLGNIKRMRGEKEEALGFHHKALAIQLEVLRWDHTDLAETYNSLGILYDSMGKSALALDFYQKSLEIWEHQAYPNYESIASIHNNMGALYTVQKEFSNALDSYKKTLATEKRYLLRNDLSFIITYNNIGSTYTKINDFPNALQFYHKALHIYQKSSTDKEQLLTQTYRNLGIAHKRMADYPQALKYFYELIKVEEKSYGIDHLLLGNTYLYTGLIHYRMGQYSKSMIYYSKTLEIYQKYLPPGHIDTAMVYSYIGEVYKALRNPKQAIASYEKAMIIGQQIWDQSDPHLRMWQKKLSELNEQIHFLPLLENRQFR